MSLDFKILFLVLCMAGCNAPFDEADFNATPKVVVDGYIEQGEYPRVYLTYSSGYYQPVDSASLQQMVLTTARVEVSDGVNSEVLTLFRNSEIYPPYYYQATDLKGEAGKTYHLEVRSKQGVYTATTTIPHVVPLDTAWILPEANKKDLGKLWIRFTDDQSTNDYYRVFLKIKNKREKYFPAYQSTLSDRTFENGFAEYPILNLPSSFIELDDDIFFQKGDTITIKFCSIDKAQYDFWRSLENEIYLVGNPFGSTGNPINSNVSGNQPVLGVWGGYGVSYRKVAF